MVRETLWKMVLSCFVTQIDGKPTTVTHTCAVWALGKDSAVSALEEKIKEMSPIYDGWEILESEDTGILSVFNKKTKWQ